MISFDQKRGQDGSLLQYIPAGWLTVLAAACAAEPGLVYDPMGSTVLSEVLHAFRALPAVCVLLIPAAALFYRRTDAACGRQTAGMPEWLLGFFYSVCMILGRSFELTGSWALLFGSGVVQGIKAAVMMAGGMLLFRSMIRWAEWLAARGWQTETEWKMAPRFRASLGQRPFRTAFAALLVLYIPYMVISWPVTLMGDADAILTQGFPEAGVVLPVYMRGHLLSESVFLNAHHPAAHTVLVHLFLRAGLALTGNADIAISLYAVFQLLCMLAAAAWLIREAAVLMGVPANGLLGMLLFYAFLPVSRGYMFLLSKDVFYTMFLMLFLSALYRIILDGRPEAAPAGYRCRRRETYAALLLAALGMLLFRNEGRYVLLLAAFAAAWLHRGLRRRALALAGCVLAAGFLYFHVLLPACHVTGGSVREMLSVPVQQTARYVRAYPDEVTEEEAEAIRAVLDYDGMAEKYDPELSDPVKNTWKEEADREDLLRYGKVWLQMFCKHPGVYVQAFLHNYYLYAYPGSRPMELYRYSGSEKLFDLVNGYLEPVGVRFAYPALWKELRYRIDTFRKTLSECPPVNLLMNTAMYVWTILFLLFYAWRRHCRDALVLLAVPAVTLLVLFTGPCNGNYSRYIYPIVMSMPLLAPGVIRLCRAVSLSENNAG